MSDKKSKIKIGATPGKLATVGVLAAILVFIIWEQLPEGVTETVSLPESSVQQSTTNVTTPNQTITHQTTKQETNKRKEKLPAWPTTKLAETLASNPFTPPLWAASKAPITDPSKLTALGKLQQQGATIVVISNGKKSATIGKNKYIVGDVLAGHRVTDITTQGLLLEEL